VPKRTLKKRRYGGVERDRKVRSVPQNGENYMLPKAGDAGPKPKSGRSHGSIIDACAIEVIWLEATYVASPGERALIDTKRIVGVLDNGPHV
jgi:hypothetical protein